jgi:acyl-CoA synthetase (AMP-forming)/AMP-acid ligase II
MHVFALLQHAVTLWPDAVAVVAGARRVTYREVHARVLRVAAELRRRGVRAGDRVAVLDGNGLEFLECYFAAAALDAVLVPLNWRLAPPEIAAILSDAGAGLAIARRAFADRLAAARGTSVLWAGEGEAYEEIARHGTPAPVPPRAGGADAVAQLYYTSGTTGEPKGVMLTHRNVCTHALAAIAELHLTDADVWGHFAPMFHLADAWATFAVTWVGGRHVMLARFDPELAFDLIARERVTVTNLVPTMLHAMLALPRGPGCDTSSMRLLLSGGAPIAPALVEQLVDAFGCAYVQTYGMTETSPYLTLSALKAHHRDLPRAQRLRIAATTGRPFLTVELEVIDERGQPVARDGRSVGEIVVRGPTVTPGYWNRPDATAAAFTDGWLRTGDLAHVDAEGYVTIVDRKKDMILTGGENVYSVEVENALHRHSAVAECAVFARPDARLGEAVCAAVVLRAGASATATELIAFVKQSLAAYKAPKEIVFLAELPRTGSGKIKKSELRARAQRREFS